MLTGWSTLPTLLSLITTLMPHCRFVSFTVTIRTIATHPTAMKANPVGLKDTACCLRGRQIGSQLFELTPCSLPSAITHSTRPVPAAYLPGLLSAVAGLPES